MTIVQMPNKALIIAVVAAIANHWATGWLHTVLTAVFYIALGLWALMELFSGVNWFRRALGAVVLAYIVIKLL